MKEKEMSYAVYCVAKTGSHAVQIANRLRAGGFAPGDISVLAPDRTSGRELGVQTNSKAPEGAATGAGTGAVLGGAVGWLVGIGSLAIPGVGPLIAAGPILAALSGVAVGGAVGGLTGGLVGAGIPEFEAQQFEGRLREGNILISVHADDSDEAARAREIMSDEHAENITTGSEASVPSSR
jgi:hypothetical protein